MSQGRLIVACDFGTTTFRALVTEVFANGDLEIVGHAVQDAEGFQDGDFVDLSAGSRCIAKTIRALEQDSDIYVTGFTYNISGSHLRSVRATAQVPIGPGPRPIREADIEEVRNRARSMAIPFDHKILTVTPVEFSVDRVRGVVDPMGRVGSQLEMQAHLITGSRSVLHNIENAIETAKYKPLGEEVDVLATAEALLNADDREKGVILVDIGGLTTSWAVYRKGSIVANGMVALGGKHLSSDLSHGLRIDLTAAEDVKLKRGVVLRALVPEVSIDVLFDQETPAETPGLVAAILEPRVEEIFTYVKNDFGDLRELANLGAGVVLTGGGSRCRGTRQLCEEVFDLPVTRRHLPARLKGADQLPSGQWATVLGLSLWAAGDFQDSAESEIGGGGGGGGLLGKLRGMFKRKPEKELEAKG
ncbi:MAG: cell division protein FtsA [Candidatus Krumholzibacteria bacterium]|nr:cell division protein FtsA [Candidatus Krumholzibacteria bacterium]